MFYILLVTILLNGHPETVSPGIYIDNASCKKALSAYKAKSNNLIINAKCEGME